MSLNVSQTKHLRISFPVFELTVLIIRYLLLAIQSAALNIQLFAEDILLPYPYCSSSHFNTIEKFATNASIDWLHFKISKPTPKLKSTTEARLPLFVVNTHSDAVEGICSSSSPSKTKELALCQIKFPE